MTGEGVSSWTAAERYTRGSSRTHEDGDRAVITADAVMYRSEQRGHKDMGRASRWPYVRKMAWDRDRKARAVCWICGQPIDYSLAPSSADNSWEPDHVLPVHKRPDLELDLNNIKAAHRGCNRSRGDGTNGNNVIGQQSRIW